MSSVSSLGDRDVPQSDMDATQGAWNLEAPEGTGGRLVGASETTCRRAGAIDDEKVAGASETTDKETTNRKKYQKRKVKKKHFYTTPIACM